MVLLKSADLKLGDMAHEFSLIGTDGQKYSLESFVSAKALVIVFMCNHCPYVQAIWDRLVKLQAKFKEVQFVGINPNTANPEYDEETMDKMKEYFERYSMNFPYLEDPDQSVALCYGAVCTPDIFVYDSEQKLVYHGRLDDNWQDEAVVTSHDLALCLESLLSSNPVSEIQKPCMGCSIKWVA